MLSVNISVATNVGQMQLAVMPSGATSADSDLVKPSTACLEAAYALRNGRPIFPEPKTELTRTPKLPGTDGRKMSKSYGNAIELGEEPESARKKIMAAVTDPARKRRMDPGNPEICGIYYLHRAYSPPETVALVDARLELNRKKV